MEYNHVTPAVVADLEAIVGAKYVWTDRDKKIPYGQDEGTGPACLPDVVVLPASAEELAAVVRLANDAVIPVIPRGTGTGLEGGAVADSRGGIVVSTERMDRIVEINEDAMYMVVQAGVITARIQEEARKRGLLYAGDPCSGDCCCIGGNGATNAGGNRAVKYGTTRDQIYAIEVVTPTGQIAHLGKRLHKMTAGYPLEKIVIGSEGTLGIITELTLKLVPLPRATAHVLAVFPSPETALALVTALPKAGITPTCLEFMDYDVISVVQDWLKEKQPCPAGGAYMIIQLDSSRDETLDDDCVMSMKSAAAWELSMSSWPTPIKSGRPAKPLRKRRLRTAPWRLWKTSSSRRTGSCPSWNAYGIWDRRWASSSAVSATPATAISISMSCARASPMKGMKSRKSPPLKIRPARQLMSWVVPFPGNTVSVRPAKPCSPSIRIL